MGNCIFCDLIQGQIPCEKIYETEHVLAFMDIHPGVEGHVLVVPKKHSENIFDIDSEGLVHVMEAAKQLAIVLKRVLHCDGMNIFQSNGAVAFQSVFHFHIHLLPRRETDMVRLPWIPKASVAHELKELANKIRAGF